MQDSLNIIQDATISEDSVEHYSVLGMKWGHRKALAKSQGITTRQLRKQIKADNREAYRLGREATIADYTASLTAKKLAKNKAKSIGKKPTNRRVEKTARIAFADALAQDRAAKAREAVKAHRESLVKKYGATNISKIKMDKQGRVNERVNNAKNHAINAGLSALGTLASNVMLSSLGMGMVYIQPPAGRSRYALKEYNKLRKEAKQVVKVQNS